MGDLSIDLYFASRRDQAEGLKRERNNMMDILELGGYLYRKKKARIDSTGGEAPRKKQDPYVASQSWMRCLFGSAHEIVRCIWVFIYCCPL